MHDRTFEIGDAKLVANRVRDAHGDVRWTIEDAIGADGQTMSDSEVIELAHELTTYAGDVLEDALDALLDAAIEAEDVSRVAIDPDAPLDVELDVVEHPIDYDLTPTAWESLLAADREAPEKYALTGEDVDAMADDARSTLDAIAS